MLLLLQGQDSILKFVSMAYLTSHEDSKTKDFSTT